MPNWCMNNLIVSHTDKDMVQKFADAYNTGAVCQQFIPMPEGEDWYSWNVSNWGTKWDFGKNEYTDPAVIENDKVVISFNSAWSPPVQFYEKLIELDYDIRATYFEPGMAYCGIWDNGIDNYIEYGGDMNKEDIIPVALWNEYAMDDFFEVMEQD